VTKNIEISEEFSFAPALISDSLVAKGRYSPQRKTFGWSNLLRLRYSVGMLPNAIG
jgi:hypothetical protein